jgi:NADH-quinone oxidoreductase subunit L
MVTAGVYLIVRSADIFNGAPTARMVVAAVGAFTLILGAVIGMAKDDLKKALAASTMSQIGYMMLAAGLGPVGYAFAIFHLVTHGFFKAGMFLGAGSVMHGMNDRVNMRRFGALRAAMITTWVTFGIGWLAILGIPPFSGYFSKDKIIEAAFIGEGWQPWVFGGAALIGAGLTAFYMSRLFFMTFHGKARWEDDQHPHESPLMMTVPMMILAVGSAFLGLILATGDRFITWLEPVTGHVEHEEPVLPVGVLIALTLILVAIGIVVAWRKYGAAEVPLEAPAASLITIAARNDMFQDSVNRAVFQRPGQHLTRTLVYADSALVDGAVNGTAAGIAKTGEVTRKGQSGQVRGYAATMLIGLVILVIIVVQGGL